MERPIEEPIVRMKPGPGAKDEAVTTHPAFCQIGAYRTQGSHGALYDSDFLHNSVIRIRISRSELHRSLHRDWHHGRDEIVEIAMSEAQWAAFVSSMNMGSGVPCTLQRFDGEIIPGLPDPASRTAQAGEELRKTLASSIESLDKLLAGIDAMGLPKGKAAALKSEIEWARMNLNSNVPFAAEQFDEHVEGTVERAKAEVHGYMTGAIQRAGLEALGAPPPLAIKHLADQDDAA